MSNERLRLDGSAVLVTGGSSGIGAAVCRLLANRGARVAVGYHTGRQRAEAVVAEITRAGGDGVAVSGDVSDAQSASALTRDAEDTVGPLSVLVNSAGGFWETHPFEDLPDELWQRGMALNFFGPMYCTRAVIGGMRERGHGSVVNLSSIVSRTGGPGETAHYASAKGALETLTYSLAREYASTGVRVNAVAPGIVDTPVHDGNRARFERLASGYAPIGRPGQPEEIAEVVAFLASEAAAYVTGQVWHINGGRL